MNLSAGQLDKLSDLCLDIAKGMFLAALAIPAIASEVTILGSVRSTLVGILFTFLALRAIRLKENGEVISHK